MNMRKRFLSIWLCLCGLGLTGALISLAPAQAAGPQQPWAVEPSPRYGHTMVVISNTVYLFGGEDGSLRSPQGELLNDTWAYNGESNEWQIIDALNPPPARKNHAAAVLEDKMYIFYGQGASGMLSDIWEYDPATNTWTQMPSNGASMPTKASHATVNIYEGMFYFYGGRSAGGYPVNPYAYLYDVRSGYWNQRAEHPEGARYGHTTTAFDNKLWVYGGTDGNSVFNDLWRYDPAVNTWTQVFPRGVQPAGRAFHTTTPAGDGLVVCGGENPLGVGYLNGAFLLPREEVWYPCNYPCNWGGRSQAQAAVIPSSGGAQSQAADTSILVFGGLRDGQPIAEPLIFTASQPLQFYLPFVGR